MHEVLYRKANYKDISDGTWLILAASTGHLEEVKELLKKIYYLKDYSEVMALYLAAQNDTLTS